MSPNVEQDLGSCIELIKSAATSEEAFDKYCSVMAASGYDQVTYSLVTDHPSLQLPRQHGLATSYPSEWMEYYNEKHYMDVDPVVERVLTSSAPFFWRDIMLDKRIADRSLRMMQEAGDAGLNDGIGFPLHGQPGEIVGVGIARSSPTGENESYAFLASTYLISTFFHATYRQLLTSHKTNRPAMTEREKDVLLWASEGKTDIEIGIILGITFHTVRFHWRRIFYKLGVKGRNYAITKAIRLNLISPVIIRVQPLTNSGS